MEYTQPPEVRIALHPCANVGRVGDSREVLFERGEVDAVLQRELDVSVVKFHARHLAVLVDDAEVPLRV